MVSQTIWSEILRSAAISFGVKLHSNFPIIRPLWYEVRSSHLLSLTEIDSKGVRKGIGLMLKSMGCKIRVENACQKCKKNRLICGVTVAFKIYGCFPGDCTRYEESIILPETRLHLNFCCPPTLYKEWIEVSILLAEVQPLEGCGSYEVCMDGVSILWGHKFGQSARGTGGTTLLET